MKQYEQIIFLSMENTLLSPIAEAIYRKNAPADLPKVISRGLVVLFEEPINPKCNMLLTRNSFPMTGHGQSRQIVKEDLEKTSLVITMNLSEKVKFAEDFGMVEDVYTLGEYVGFDTDLVNPSGAEDEKYQECFEEILLRVNRLIQKLKQSE
ncbi:MAG: hypothetical protein IJ733_00915 [Lachnospiraceae bacterium]|nr:hypothetical protein [Lachnospiraceae bacterium]